MPWFDWQFYVVTAAAVWGAWTLLRQLLPGPASSGPACGACASGASACVKKPNLSAATMSSDSPLVVLGNKRPSER